MAVLSTMLAMPLARLALRQKDGGAPTGSPARPIAPAMIQTSCD